LSKIKKEIKKAFRNYNKQENRIMSLVIKNVLKYKQNFEALRFEYIISKVDSTELEQGNKPSLSGYL